MRRFALVVFLLLLSRPASAADEADRLVAETLFKEARALLADGHPDQACEKFAASQKLDPSVGALFNLADCAVRRGETASAWLFLRDAAALAARNGDRERERAALSRADALPLSKLVLRVHAGTPSITVRRDGTVIDPALFGVGVPVNPGSHLFEASAPGRRGWQERVDVPSTATVLTVEVPALSLAFDAPTPPAASSTSTSHTAAIIVGGAAVLSLTAGVVFGVKASSEWSDVTDVCPNRQCPDAKTAADLDSQRQDAFRDSVISTVAFGVSAVSTVAAVYLWLSDRKSGTTALQPGAVRF